MNRKIQQIAIITACLTASSVIASTEKNISTQVAALQARYDSADGGGVYFNPESGKVIVNITESGALSIPFTTPSNVEFKSVKYSYPELQSIKNVLVQEFMNEKFASQTRDMSVGINVPDNRIDITVGPGTSAETINKVKDKVSALADKVVLHYTTEPLMSLYAAVNNMEGTETLLGGSEIWADYGNYSTKCSVGFNVYIKNEPWFLTAGHCGENGTLYHSPGKTLYAEIKNSVFKGSDYALAKYTKDYAYSQRPSRIDLYNGKAQDINSFGSAYVGRPVSRSGATTHLRTGHVVVVDSTINMSGTILNGMVGTDACAEGGDSGGPFFDNDVALGVLSGGSGNCQGGTATTYFTPIDKLSTQYNLTLK